MNASLTRRMSAAEVADFCLTAIEQLVCDLRAGDGSGALEISDEILRRSDERFERLPEPGRFEQRRPICAGRAGVRR